MTKVLRLAVATIGLLVILLPVTGTLSLTFAQAAPATGTWKLTGSMHVARYDHTATLLKISHPLMVQLRTAQVSLAQARPHTTL